MSVLGMVLAASLSGPAPLEPVLWLHPKGDVLLNGVHTPSRLTPGAKTVQTPVGLGLDLNGTHGGLLLPDLPALRLTRSISVSAWVYLRSYAPNGAQSQILFRGDDRDGFDPYDLAILADGTVDFVVEGSNGGGANVAAEIPLQKWVHVTASYDSGANELKLWMDDILVSTRLTAYKPFADLDAAFTPGVSFGNVQNDRGRHNQPLDGMIADVRLYAGVVEPFETRPIRR